MPALNAIPRRAVLISAPAAIAVYSLPGLGYAAAPVIAPGHPSSRRFSVFYAGERIGTHTITHSPRTGETRITTSIDLAVKAFLFTVFVYNHRSEEIWRGGRLVSLDSKTVEDGATLLISGAATASGFRVVGKGGPFIASAETLTSNSLWNPAVMAQKTVIDAQHGGVIGVSARKLADERILVGGRPVRATRHSFITPYLAGDIWYDEDGHWVRGDFERNGSKILYRLDA